MTQESITNPVVVNSSPADASFLSSCKLEGIQEPVNGPRVHQELPSFLPINAGCSHVYEMVLENSVEQK